MMTYSETLNYWFSAKNKKHWFNSTPQIDVEIREKFKDLWESAAAGKLNSWQKSPESALALIIVLDQLPLNMFRGKAKCFATETKALEVVLKAIEKGYDKKMRNHKLMFLLMPLAHSEKLSDQDLHVKLIQRYALRGQVSLMLSLRFAKHHRNLIREFGRFPHRNTILGRESTKAELAYLASKRAFTG